MAALSDPTAMGDKLRKELVLSFDIGMGFDIIGAVQESWSDEKMLGDGLMI